MVDFDAGLLNQWLRVNGCRQYDTPATGSGSAALAPAVVLTHLLLSGGRLVVPDIYHTQFLIELTRCHARGDPMYIVEMPTLEGYKLYCEIDMCLSKRHISTREFATHVLPVMQEVLLRIFPEADTTAVLCETTPKRVKSKDKTDPPGTMYTKTGIHIVWPGIVVTRQTAWATRAMLLIGLKDMRLPADWFPEDEASVRPHHKAFKPEGGWEETLDKAVFEKNGLRTIWSRKASVCRECENSGLKGDKRALGAETCNSSGLQGLRLDKVLFCSKCLNTGKVDEGRPYVPVLRAAHASPGLAADAALVDISGMDMYDQMLLCSIRIVPRLGQPGCPARLSVLRLNPTEKALAAGFAQFQQSECRPRASKRKMQECGIAGDAAAELAPPASKKSKRAAGTYNKRLVPLLPSGPEWDFIVQHVLATTGCRAINAKVNEGPGPRAVYAVSTTCHYCSNKRDKHGGSTVWFLFLPNGVHQRCWSPKTPPGSKIPCDCYQGPAIPYPDPATARAVLFPDLHASTCSAGAAQSAGPQKAPIVDVSDLPIQQQKTLVYKENEKCVAEAGLLPFEVAMALAAQTAKPKTGLIRQLRL